MSRGSCTQPLAGGGRSSTLCTLLSKKLDLLCWHADHIPMNTKSVLPAEVDPSPYVAYAQQALQSAHEAKQEQQQFQYQQWLDSIAVDPNSTRPEDAACRKEVAKIPDARAVKGEAMFLLFPMFMVNRYMPPWFVYVISAWVVYIIGDALWRLRKIKKR